MIKLKIKCVEPDRQNRDLVAMIKLLRSATSMGLKAAKDLLDESLNREMTINVLHPTIDPLVDQLLCESRKCGYRVTKFTSEYVDSYLAALRPIAAEAILAGHDDIAQDLIDLINSYS